MMGAPCVVQRCEWVKCGTEKKKRRANIYLAPISVR
jgi:hypothetical protein